MHLLIICLLLATLLHVISKIPLTRHQLSQKEGYNNSNPRKQQQELAKKGKAARALAAHQNQIESYPFFAVGIVVACAVAAPDTHAIAGLIAITYLISRALYIFFYIKDISTSRSLVWAVGFACSIALISTPLWS